MELSGIKRCQPELIGMERSQAELSGTGPAPKFAFAGLNDLVCLLPAHTLHRLIAPLFLKSARAWQRQALGLDQSRSNTDLKKTRNRYVRQQ